MRTVDALRQAAGRIAPGDARVLLAAALSTTRLALSVEPDRTVGGEEARLFADFVKRRESGEPVSRILGRREFWSLEFEIDPAVLDPRPDTEAVVEAALASTCDRDAPLEILDLGCGSGCIVLALLSELPRARGVGLDRSVSALRMARSNARRLGLADRCIFVAADWAAPLRGAFDVVVSNPPYVRRDDIASLDPDVANFDPHCALDGGWDGLDAYRRISGDLPRLMRGGGVAVLEVGDGQAASAAQVLCSADLTQAGARLDLAGRERCVVLRRLEKNLGM